MKGRLLPGRCEPSCATQEPESVPGKYARPVASVRAESPLTLSVHCFVTVELEWPATQNLAQQVTPGASSSNVTVSSSCCIGVSLLSMRLIKRQSPASGQTWAVLCQQSKAPLKPGFSLTLKNNRTDKIESHAQDHRAASAVCPTHQGPSLPRVGIDASR